MVGFGKEGWEGDCNLTCRGFCMYIDTYQALRLHAIVTYLEQIYNHPCHTSMLL